MKNIRKTVALVVTICMVLALLPVSALGAGTLTLSVESLTFDSESPARQEVRVIRTASHTSDIKFTWELSGSNGSKFSLYSSQDTATGAGRLSSSDSAWVGITPGETLSPGDKAILTVSCDGESGKIEISVPSNDEKKPVTLQAILHVINGSAYYLGAGGVETPLGANEGYIQVYSDVNGNLEYIDSTYTDSSGNFEFFVPEDRKSADSYKVYIYATGKGYMLTQTLSGINYSSSVSVSGADAASGTSIKALFYRIPTQFKATVVNDKTNETLPGITVIGADGTKVEGSYVSDSSGVITFGGRAIAPGFEEWTLSVKADGFEDYNNTLSVRATIQQLIDGVVDFGQVRLVPKQPIDPSSDFADVSKNYLTVNNTHVSPGGESRSELFLNTPVDYDSAEIRISVDNESRIIADGLDYLSIKEDGQPVTRIIDHSIGDSEIMLKMELSAGKSYQISLYSKAPMSGGGYSIRASVNGTQIGSASVALHTVTLDAPSEIGVGESFSLSGEASAGQTVALSIDGPTGNVYSKYVVCNGLVYLHTVPKDVLKETGTYTISVGAGGVSVSRELIVKHLSVTIEEVTLGWSTNFYHPVTATEGRIAYFGTSVFLSGAPWGSYYHIGTRAKVTNISRISSAKFILKTTAGNYTKTAIMDESKGTLSCVFDNFIGYDGTIGLIDVEITKIDGTVFSKTLGDVLFYHDPSGYVYDAESNERLQGVQVTLYEKVNGEWRVWDGAANRQQNPKFTDSEGRYYWGVTSGVYKVEARHAGYEDYSTLDDSYGEIKVPPSRDDINIGMKKGQTTGQIEVDTSSSYSAVTDVAPSVASVPTSNAVSRSTGTVSTSSTSSNGTNSNSSSSSSSSSSANSDKPTPIVPVLYDFEKHGESFQFKTFIAHASTRMVGSKVTVKLNDRYSTDVTIDADGVGRGTLETPGFISDVAIFTARVHGAGNATVTKPMVISSSGEVLPR